MGASWNASLLAKLYPELSRINDQGICPSNHQIGHSSDFSVFVIFGEKNFQKGPAVLLTESIQNLRLGVLLTMIAMSYDKLVEFITVTRYAEQMRENVMKFDLQRGKPSWTKMKGLRLTFIPFLLQQNRFGTGGDETIQREEVVRRHAGGMPLLTYLYLAMRIDPLELMRGL